jgi:hypothetical protein
MSRRLLNEATLKARQEFDTYSRQVALPSAETAAIIGVSVSWLKSDRLAAAKGAELRGPRPTIIADNVRYIVADIRSWLADQYEQSGVVSQSKRGGLNLKNVGGRPKGARTQNPLGRRVMGVAT